jgi:hypothetical protein
VHSARSFGTHADQALRHDAGAPSRNIDSAMHIS